MAPEIHSNQASTKSDVYSFGVLLIRLVNGSPLTLDGDEILIRHFIQWVQEVQKEEDGFQQIFDVAINNSIVGFDPNEAKLILQISLQCIKEDPNQRPEMQEVLQHLEGFNKKKGLQYIVSVIQESFNTLSKRIWVSSARKGRDIKGKPLKNNIKRNNEQGQREALLTGRLIMCPQAKK
jgi:serine/threonine protein kinase